MGRQKKNELDAILEQLKKSYATDVDNDLEDSLLNEEETAEDAELASVLEKIFASSSDVSNVTYEETESDTEEILDEDQDQETSIYDDEQTETSNDVSKIDESENEAPEHQTDDTAFLGSFDEDNTEEEEKVDDVLKMMFHQDSCVSAEETDDTEKVVTDDSYDMEKSFVEDSLETEKHTSLLDIFLRDDLDETNVYNDLYGDQTVDYEESSENETIEIVEIEEVFDDEMIALTETRDEYPESDEVSDYKVEIEDDFEINIDDGEDEPYSCGESSLIEQLIDSDEEEAEIVSKIADEDVSVEDEAECGAIKKLILDPEEYTEDILQHPLSDMTLFKPEVDIDFSSVYSQNEGDEDEQQEISVDATAPSLPEANISDNDISLLMKFGYSSEITSSVGNEYAQAVVVEKNNEYVPKKHRIIHGFTGKEFSDKSQIEGITKKYRSDKMRLLILSIIISVFALAAIAGDIIASLSNNVNDYMGVLLSEELIVVLTVVLLGKRLHIGSLGIIRFDANDYSMLSVILVEYLMYCSAMEVLYIISPLLVYNNVYIAMGGYVMAYAAMTVWAEYLDCCRERFIFKIMSDGDIHCVLEKKSSEGIPFNEKKSKHTDLTYSIKRSSLLSGYFRRMYDRSTSKVNIVLAIGVIPFTAIVIGLVTAIFRNNVASGINSAGYVMFCTIPLSAVFVPAVIEYVNSIKLGHTHSAFIGFDSVEEYSGVKSLRFSDCDVVEISAITEINPNKNSDGSKKWLNIAANVFEALGGPLSETVKSNRAEDSNISHDATINSISENGIDLYFDSSMNVLIGDRQYMLAHNIKVKTDTNLSTAVKGVDRTVIYMAFDGIPQLGFIVTSKIKRSFLETVELLEKQKIQICVNSYEPEINDYYFESNGIGNTLSVYKPTTYEQSEPSTILDSGIISSTPHDLCGAIIYGQKVLNDRKTAKKTRIMQTVVGFVLAALLVAVSCLTPNNLVVAVIQSNALPIFYGVTIIGLIPNVVQIIRLIKRK